MRWRRLDSRPPLSPGLCHVNLGFLYANYKTSKIIELVPWLGTSFFLLCKKKEITMLEIIITVSLYLGAIALLVKGAISYCNNCQE